MIAETNRPEASAAANSTTYRCTFGHYLQTGPWTDIRTLTWPEITTLLTRHEVGIKEGKCIVPAVFSGARRNKNEARQIDVAFLDSDAGAMLQEIAAAIAERGWTAVVSSTHSHLTTTTRANRGNWDRFRLAAAAMDKAASPADFLIAEKGYLPRVAAGARIVSEDSEYVAFQHQPCPKFRIALPLLLSWVAANYDDQHQANAVWKERIEALAAALGLAHDQACTDTSRLFYLPRRPEGGPAPETAVLEGVRCDLFALPVAAEAGPSERGSRPSGAPRRRRGTDEATDLVDPETGAVVDLAAWVRQHGDRFEIVSALRARRPEVLTGKVAEGAKHHIRCPNEAAHTQAGADAATFAVDAGKARNRGFAVHCRHAHCDGRDRLLFLRQMLEQDWLRPADLVDPRFQTGSRRGEERDEEIELTEHGVALAFARRHADALRYCHTAGAWYVWTGTRWAKDCTRIAFAWARGIVAEMNRGAEFKIRAITGKAGFAAAVERFAQADEALAVTAEAWDADPFLLGTPGGTVDLRTGRLRPALRSDGITRCTAVPPAASPDCPAWMAFLQQATGGDDGLIRFLQRWFGYCLTGSTREHALLFLHGPGGNGKGVLLVTAAGIFADYAATAAMDTFTASAGDRPPTDLAMLHGARLVMTTETEEGRAWAEARIKALTGGDPISARFMRRDFFTYTPAFKLAISGNHKPALRNVDDAARRRFNVVPFLNKPIAPDPSLTEKLRAEWPGILRWMVDGCTAWQRDGLARPRSVIDATDEYFAEQDVLAQWVAEGCERGTGFGESNPALFASWRRFALEQGEEPRNVKWLGSMLEHHGFARGKDCGLFRGRGFRGIRVRRGPPEPPTDGASEDG